MNFTFDEGSSRKIMVMCTVRDQRSAPIENDI